VVNPLPERGAPGCRRVAVVTGGAGAIGAAIAPSREESGHRTVVIDRTGSIPWDLGSESSTREAAPAVPDRYRPGDVFVQSAGAFDQVALGELDSATWHVFAVNVEPALCGALPRTLVPVTPVEEGVRDPCANDAASRVAEWHKLAANVMAEGHCFLNSDVEIPARSAVAPYRSAGSCDRVPGEVGFAAAPEVEANARGMAWPDLEQAPVWRPP
jgi:NAD(P)-dependent dehydrogenase (short-subunit alcohol dehydrogenase family)